MPSHLRAPVFQMGEIWMLFAAGCWAARVIFLFGELGENEFESTMKVGLKTRYVPSKLPPMKPRDAPMATNWKFSDGFSVRPRNAAPRAAPKTVEYPAVRNIS